MVGYKKYLSDDERSKILEMKSGGKNISEIAKEIHRSRDLVRKFLKDPDAYVQNMKERSGSAPKEIEISNNLNNQSASFTTAKKITSTPIKEPQCPQSEENISEGQNNENNCNGSSNTVSKYKKTCMCCTQKKNC